MTYPSSSDVAGGQPTLAAHYNNLRKDALYLGNLSTESIPIGSFIEGLVTGMKLEYLATNRVKVPHVAAAPAKIMIDGYLLQSYADVELSAGMFSGTAATWYIFAVRASTSTFTLNVSTSAAVVPGTRLIGQCYWDGTNILAGSVYSYFSHNLPPPDYDSGYFAVTYNTTYAKTHNLKSIPAVVVLLHCTSATGAAAHSVVGNVGPTSGIRVPIYYDTTTITCETGNDATNGTLLGRPSNSAGGYYRILAWRSA